MNRKLTTSTPAHDRHGSVSDDEVARPDAPSATPPPTAAASSVTVAASDVLVEQELLVEDVSIDGMCGVY